MNRLTVNDYPFWGEFYYSTRSNLDKSLIDKKIKQYYYANNQILNISEYQVYYLKKIMNLCADNNIRVYLYNSPVYIEHYNQIPEFFVKSYNSILKDLLRNYGNVQYIDFSTLNLPDDHYGDGDHLNANGAKRISTMIDSLLSI